MQHICLSTALPAYEKRFFILHVLQNLVLTFCNANMDRKIEYVMCWTQIWQHFVLFYMLTN